MSDLPNPRESLMKDALVEPSMAETISRKPISLSHHEQAMMCPSCHSLVVTETKRETTSKTHLVAGILTPFLCCCLPYLMNWKNVQHYCPECYKFIGSYEF